MTTILGEMMNGKKKYKSKLTERPVATARRQPSSLSREISPGPPDMRSNFFSREDVSPLAISGQSIRSSSSTESNYSMQFGPSSQSVKSANSTQQYQSTSTPSPQSGLPNLKKAEQLWNGPFDTFVGNNKYTFLSDGMEMENQKLRTTRMDSTVSRFSDCTESTISSRAPSHQQKPSESSIASNKVRFLDENTAKAQPETTVHRHDPFSRYNSYLSSSYDITGGADGYSSNGSSPYASPRATYVASHFVPEPLKIQPFNEPRPLRLQRPSSEQDDPVNGLSYYPSEIYNRQDSMTLSEDQLPPLTDRSGSEATATSFGSSYRHSVLKTQLEALKRTDEKEFIPIMLLVDDSEPQKESIHKKGPRAPKRWYGTWSTRSIILMVVGIIALSALAIGISVGLYQNKVTAEAAGLTPTWRPAMGNTWQIQLSSPVTNPSLSAYVYDIDLFDNSADIISNLHSLGRRVVCYFSAGTYESWRPDAYLFPNSTKGTALENWRGEYWLDTRDKTVRKIMTDRIDVAISKGCDAVDPDNTDGYNEDTSFPLSVTDGISYMRFLANYAHVANIAIGLKNSPELINGTLDVIDWQLNESCAEYNECQKFQPFIEAGKPVFHIEYATGANVSLLNQACNAPGTQGFSTMLKKSALDSWSMSCPFGDALYEAY